MGRPRAQLLHAKRGGAAQAAETEAKMELERDFQVRALCRPKASKYSMKLTPAFCTLFRLEALQLAKFFRSLAPCCCFLRVDKDGTVVCQRGERLSAGACPRGSGEGIRASESTRYGLRRHPSY